MKKIIFVCSGNTCRSPLALASWRALEKSGKTPPNIAAGSAGLMATASTPASKFAVEIARHWNEDLSIHRAQMLEPKTAQSADWIAVMNASHAFALQYYLGVDDDKIILLGRFDPQNGDDEIFDPFGGSREGYETCAIHIRRAVKNLALALQNEEI